MDMGEIERQLKEMAKKKRNADGNIVKETEQKRTEILFLKEKRKGNSVKK